MPLEELLQLALDNILYTAVIGIILLFLLFRIFRTMRMHFGAKNFVKSARKLDSKKFNGINLVNQTKRKRKRDSNSFNKLRQRSKNKVRRYFEHKIDELPVVCRYKYSKVFKRSNKEVIIFVKKGRKTLKKIQSKKAMRSIIDATNKYECLDEMITFLHHLPEAILEGQDYEIYANYDEILITYQIK